MISSFIKGFAFKSGVTRYNLLATTGEKKYPKNKDITIKNILNNSYKIPFLYENIMHNANIAATITSTTI